MRIVELVFDENVFHKHFYLIEFSSCSKTLHDDYTTRWKPKQLYFMFINWNIQQFIGVYGCLKVHADQKIVYFKRYTIKISFLLL